MKRKIYFIITSIIGILCSIWSIIYSKKLIESSLDSVKETYSMFPKDFQERVINILANGGSLFIKITSILTIIFSIITIIYTVKNKISDKKTTFIILSIIECLISSISILQLMYFINIIVSITIKGSPKEKIKKEIPKIEYKKSSKKELIKPLILLVIYFSQFIWGRFLNEKNAMIIEIIFYISMLVLSILFYKKELKEHLILFKNNFKEYMKFIIPRYLIGIILFAIINLISILITNKATSINQQTIESLPNWYILPLAVIWAPIVEELVFRVSIRKIINNQKLFIIVSSLIFGFMHAVNEATMFNMIITTLPYATLGAVLAYIYTKTNNIISNMSVHFIQNTLSSLLTLFLV